MKQRLSKRKPLLLVLALGSAMTTAGVAIAQQPSTNPATPPSANSPANTSNGGAMRSDAAGAGMTSKSLSRTDSADSAWQKIGSKGYVTKDDVKDLSGFSFEAADANHDGRLTQDEFRRAWQAYASGAAGAGTSAPSGTAPSSSASPSSTSGGTSTPSGTAPSGTYTSPSSGATSSPGAPK
jgi:hypothetical protein